MFSSFNDVSSSRKKETSTQLLCNSIRGILLFPHGRNEGRPAFLTFSLALALIERDENFFIFHLDVIAIRNEFIQAGLNFFPYFPFILSEKAERHIYEGS